jgi:hypothetical protein
MDDMCRVFSYGAKRKQARTIWEDVRTYVRTSIELQAGFFEHTRDAGQQQRGTNGFNLQAGGASSSSSSSLVKNARASYKALLSPSFSAPLIRWTGPNHITRPRSTKQTSRRRTRMSHRRRTTKHHHSSYSSSSSSSPLATYREHSIQKLAKLLGGEDKATEVEQASD